VACLGFVAWLLAVFFAFVMASLSRGPFAARFVSTTNECPIARRPAVASAVVSKCDFPFWDDAKNDACRSAPPRAEIDQLPDGAEDVGDRTDQGGEAIASPSVDDDQEDPLRRSAPRPE
jgi:hypothetical protein